jgi:hypothetical protein
MSQWCPGFSSHSRQKFDCPEVAIDKSALNPARIIKLYGSPVHKGDHPNTTLPAVGGDSAKADEDQTFEPVQREQLAALASEVDEPKQEKTARNGSSSVTQPFDIEGFIKKHLADVARDPEPYLRGRRWVLSEFPFYQGHDHGGKAVLSNSPTARCHSPVSARTAVISAGVICGSSTSPWRQGKARMDGMVIVPRRAKPTSQKLRRLEPTSNAMTTSRRTKAALLVSYSVWVGMES